MGLLRVGGRICQGRSVVKYLFRHRIIACVFKNLKNKLIIIRQAIKRANKAASSHSRTIDLRRHTS